MKTCLGGIYMSNEGVRLNDFITIDIKTVQKLFSEYDSKIEVTNLRLVTERLRLAIIL